MPEQKAAAPLRAFIAYDFALVQGSMFADVLAHARDTQPAGLDINYPGAPDDANHQGTIWRSVVQPGIEQAGRVLAFIDLPNANVGFEIGYAIGCGKEVAVYRYKPAEHPWHTEAPLRGCFRTRIHNARAIQQAFLNDHFLPPADPAPAGDGVLVLCPDDVDGRYLSALKPEWGWRLLPDAAWDIETLPRLLKGVGHVLWVILPHEDGAAERDGQANAALSVLAGYATALTDRQVQVLVHQNARPVADVEHLARRFANKAEFAAAVAQLQAQWQAARTPPPATAAADLSPKRPAHLAPLPDDAFAVQAAKFVGRETLLALAADAVTGLMQRHRKAGAASGAQNVRMIWAHGFGGMGKSWFLQRVRLDAERAHPNIATLLVDWDKREWRYPLAGEPRTANDLFEVVATRLAQKLGMAAADPYWLALARVEQHAAAHQAAMQRFDGHLLAAASGQQGVDAHLMQLLRADRLWHEDVAERARQIEKLRQDPARHREMFAAWCDEEGLTEPAIQCPQRARAAGLRDALRAALAAQPLILILDTCEVLAEHLDAWLRELLAPLLHESLPLLVLAGSRLRPDLHQPAAARLGWRQELPADALRVEAFAEGMRFTVGEVEAALATLNPPPERQPVLAAAIHRITLGVPLAVRGLLELEGEHALDALADWQEDDPPLAEAEATRRVIAIVAERMLLNLAGRPEREHELHDIVALALLPAAAPDLLQALWRQPARQRLRELARRYSLLADGDLHPTVRSYLRRHWRDPAERPGCFDAVLASLQRACAEQPAPAAADRDAAARQAALALNLRAWVEDEAVVPDIARALSLAYAYETDAAPLEALLRELPLAGAHWAATRRLWQTGDGGRPQDADIAQWLRSQHGNTWSEAESAALGLLQGLAGGSSCGNEPAQLLRALEALRKAVEFFDAGDLPLRTRAAEAFYEIGCGLAPDLQFGGKGGEWASQSALAYERSLELNPDNAIACNNLGYTYLDRLGQPEKAEAAFLRAIELDPKLAAPHNGLGNLYQDHLRQPEKAETAYLRAIELDPKFAYPHIGLGLMHEDADEWPQARACYRDALPLQEAVYGGAARGLGWVALRDGGDTDGARAWSEQAMQRDPGHPGSPLLRLAVAAWDGAHPCIAAELAAWLQNLKRTNESFVWYNRRRIAALLRRLHRHGQLADLAPALQALAGKPCFQPWAEAVTALLAGAAAPAEPRAEQIYRLLCQPYQGADTPANR
ncbi:MAG: tetratricopeptide repeat protein [Rhodocyclaceae bacterium]|nr:tetratricopeptide repeat protein [Rhodocyclaceae bacterium]